MELKLKGLRRDNLFERLQTRFTKKIIGEIALTKHNAIM